MTLASSSAGGSLFIISAPSGAGKSSLLAALRQKDASLKLSISHTTRQPRPGETNGREYHFISVDNFKDLIKKEAFLEYALVHGNYYGTAKQTVLMMLKAGYDTLLEIDWQGAQQVRKLFPEAISIFILPPSISTLEERLISRGQDSMEIIKRRVAAAGNEIKHAAEFDYIIINRQFEQALAELCAIVASARCRTAQQAAKNRALFEQFGIPF